MKMYENKLSDLHNCERSHAGVHTRRHFLLTHTHAGYTVHIPLTHKKSPVVGGRSEVANTSAGAEFLWRGQVLIATTCWHYLDTGLALCPCGKESLLGRANDDKFCRHSWSPGPALGIFAKSRWTGKRKAGGKSSPWKGERGERKGEREGEKPRLQFCQESTFESPA